jgi:hypothetical protein
VWLGVFGASALPLTKPLVATFTAATIGAGQLWMTRRDRRASTEAAPGCGESRACRCD